MKKNLSWIIAVLVLAAVFHLVAVKAFPTLVMNKLAKTSQESGILPNTIFHSPRVDDKSRRVVRPSPDLIYSICGYDVSQKPLRITAPIPNTSYWSLSLFASNTDNYFIVNDQQLKSGHLNLVLVGKGQSYSKDDDAIVVEAQTNIGAALFRMLVPDENKVEQLIKTRKMAKCQSVEL